MHDGATKDTSGYSSEDEQPQLAQQDQDNTHALLKKLMSQVGEMNKTIHAQHTNLTALINSKLTDLNDNNSLQMSTLTNRVQHI